MPVAKCTTTLASRAQYSPVQGRPVCCDVRDCAHGGRTLPIRTSAAKSSLTPTRRLHGKCEVTGQTGTYPWHRCFALTTQQQSRALPSNRLAAAAATSNRALSLPMSAAGSHTSSRDGFLPTNIFMQRCRRTPETPTQSSAATTT